jgi:molybdate transport system ATP-binding protein
MTHAFDLEARHPGFVLAARASWDARIAALFGASGSGKTTILEAIAGARPDVRGPVTIADKEISSSRPEDRGLGWVPQDASLFPHMTAAGNIAFGVRHRGDRRAAEDAIEALEIGPIRSRSARELSGGERQRVALARALASRPSFMLLDEPLASLDRPLRSRVVPFLAEIPKRFDTPVLLVTHDPLEVLALAAHVMVIESGRIVAAGDPASVFAAAASFGPLHAIGAENQFDVRPRGMPADGLLAVVTRGGSVLEVAVVPGFPAPARVAIRSEDIMLATDAPRGISAQNVLLGTVSRLEATGPNVHVFARVGGDELRAKITVRALGSLALRPGSQVFLLIKAHAVQPVP